VDVFNKIIEKRGCQLNYIIPISDNGGSSSELIRFIGGPSQSAPNPYVRLIMWTNTLSQAWEI
jgi:hypothetical protein